MALSAFTKEMLEEAIKQSYEGGLQGQLHYFSPRRHGKSMAQQAMTNAIQGKEVEYTILDELLPDDGSTSGVVVVFEDERVPAATITVSEVTLLKDHPDNPNPEAGSIRAWQAYHGIRAIGRPFMAVALAKTKAKILHEKMVEAVLAKRKELEDERQAQYKANPNYGRF